MHCAVKSLWHSESVSFILNNQGVWRREKKLTRLALPYDYTCFADGTPFENEFFNFPENYDCIANNVAPKKIFLFGVIPPTFFPA